LKKSLQTKGDNSSSTFLVVFQPADSEALMRPTARAAAALHSTSTQQHWQMGISKDFKNLRHKLKNEPVEAKPNLCILHFAFPLLFPTKKKKLSPPTPTCFLRFPSSPLHQTLASLGLGAEQSTAEQKVASGSKWPMSGGGGGGSILLAFSPRLPRSGCCSEWEREDSCCLRRFSGTPPSPGSGPRARDPELRAGELPCSGWEFLRSVDACWLR